MPVIINDCMNGIELGSKLHAPSSGCSAFQKVPQEILDAIIDHLKDDKRTLRACCLVSRSWVSRSQGHIHYETGVSWLWSYDPSRYSSPNIASLVRKLNLTLPAYQPRPGKSDVVQSKRSISWIIVRRFTCLEQLRLHSYQWQGLEEEKETFGILFKNVTCLQLRKVSAETSSDFLEFFSLFPPFRILELQDINCHSPLSKSTPQSPPKIDVGSLRRLKIGYMRMDTENYDAFVAALFHSPQDLHDIQLDWKDLRNIDRLPAMLKSIGPGLIHLSIDGRSSEPWMSSSHSLGIESCSRLQSLTISILLENRDFLSASWIPLFLSKVTSTRITKVTFIHRSENLACLGLDALAKVFSEPQFSTLVSVLFKFPQSCIATGDSDAMSSELRTKLQSLDERGILCIEWNLQPRTSRMIQVDS
ncbi:hypothetical protein C8Q75DRAFT_777824 [Abortiporus biennis]|nr:hypothetical protein C8Q75DRAFT_777824 [Abortiporus biennis]